MNERMDERRTDQHRQSEKTVLVDNLQLVKPESIVIPTTDHESAKIFLVLRLVVPEVNTRLVKTDDFYFTGFVGH